MRLSRGLTQLQLAELTGLSRVYIGYIEQGKRCGSILTYLDIVSALGYSLDDLVAGVYMDPDQDLLGEISFVLASSRGEEKDSVVRVFRELVKLVRRHHGGDFMV